MKKAILGLIPFLMVAMLITSCDKDTEEVVTTEDYIDLEITDRDGGVFGAPYGVNRCFRIQFPFTVELSDGTQITAEDRRSLNRQLKEWKANNPGEKVRPVPVFPFTVEFRDGTTMEITSEDDLASIRQTCHELLANHKLRPRPHRTCFWIVYPVEIDFPDDEDPVEVNSAREFKQLLREWRQNNEGSLERPEIVYPITVKMKRTGEEIVINDVDELKELHRSCR